MKHTLLILHLTRLKNQPIFGFPNEEHSALNAESIAESRLTRSSLTYNI